MADDTHASLIASHTEAAGKHAYFLLAAAGACIAFALTQTKEAALSPLHVPLAVALLCWAGSFFAGCRRLDGIQEHFRLNALLIRVQTGNDELVGRHPQLIAYADKQTRDWLTKEGDRTAFMARWQFRLILAGAAFYVAWHVAEMAARAHYLPQLLTG